MDHPTCNYDCSTTYIKTRENQFSYRYCFAISLQKNLEKIIGILLWAASLVHHVRFLLTSLYRDLHSIPATNYNVKPTEWEYFLNLLNDCATITVHNHLHLPIGSKVVEFKHTPISSSSQLPRDIPIERHAWIRLRDPNCDKRRLSDTSKETLLWSKRSLQPLLRSIPLSKSTQMTISAAADAFAADDEMGIGGWIKLENNLFWFSHIWNKQELQPFLDIPKKPSKVYFVLGSFSSTLHTSFSQSEMYYQTWHHQYPIRIRQHWSRGQHQPRLLQHQGLIGYYQMGFYSTNSIQHFSQHPPHPR